MRGKNVTTGANIDWDTSYGYNYFAAYQSNIYFEGSGANIVYHDLGVVMSEIKNPAQTVAIADTDAPTIEIIERPRVFYRVAGGKGYLTERHLGGINVLWMDGHVKWTKISALVQPPDCTSVPATVIANACDNDGSLWDRN